MKNTNEGDAMEAMKIKPVSELRKADIKTGRTETIKYYLNSDLVRVKDAVDNPAYGKEIKQRIKNYLENESNCAKQDDSHAD